MQSRGGGGGGGDELAQSQFLDPDLNNTVSSGQFSFPFSSDQDGIGSTCPEKPILYIYSYMHSTSSLRSFPKIAFETVPMFAWLTTALSDLSKKTVMCFHFFACLISSD